MTMEMPKSIDVALTPDELAGMIEALHDGILRRLRWTTYIDTTFTKWRQLDLSVVQTVIDNFISAYSKAVMVYRDANFANRGQFEQSFVFNDGVWDLLAKVSTAASWEEVPMHSVHKTGCEICTTIFGN